MLAKEYPFIKVLSMTKVKPDGFEQYLAEIDVLGDAIYEILDKGKEWSSELTSALNDGGGVIFPHTYISKCGDQIGAVVHAVLNSGADQAILLGTLHPFGPLFDARVKEFNKEDISREPSWGVIAPDSPKGHLLENEFSLILFKALLKIEAERRGIKPPKLIERYPSLVNRHPEMLPGMEELKMLTKNAVIVGTEDYCHHGVAYAVPKESAMPVGDSALAFARQQVEKGFSLLEQNKHSEFYDHGMHTNAIGDPSDVSATLHYLVGSHSKPKILDLKLVDVSPLFVDDPSPSWVAVTLAKITKR